MFILYIVLGVLALIAIAVVIELIKEFWVGILGLACIIFGILFLTKRKRKSKLNQAVNENSNDNLNNTLEPGAVHYQREYRVSGVSYRNNDIVALGHLNPNFDLTKKQMYDQIGPDAREYEYNFDDYFASLVPEPSNKHDQNAIRVEIDGRHVGYIPRGLCSQVHQILNSGKLRHVKAVISGGRYRELQNTVNDTSREPRSADFKLRTSRIDYFIRLYMDIES